MQTIEIMPGVIQFMPEEKVPKEAKLISFQEWLRGLEHANADSGECQVDMAEGRN
ncbi:hypothetical protein [Atopococcus tabaci]|uniref:hypothetical protein n=1 Tax=Atopococcus tabaci TaxID=269774 RepID=UPI00240A5D69|nr:hypothetical protein [Atopococcus tabaci]